MRWIVGLSLGASLGLGGLLAWAADAPPPAAKKLDPKEIEFFESKIRPVLAQQCFACHNEKNIKGGLRLDTAAEFFKGGDTGPLVTPGDPEKSLLIQAISYKLDHLKMPPQGKLKPQQLADFEAWVKMGAPWPNYTPAAKANEKPGGSLFTDEQKKFWAFQPVRNPAPPSVKNKAWVTSPIDAFILAKLEEKGLQPAPKADRRTLIRRVTFDLTGLPPTPEEVAAFVNDQSPNAWEKVIDRLLASPAYGERWGRHWLDVARYADSNGLDENTAFANAFRYRDYVVRAFNEDKPYDQFIREQLAGDLLPASDDPQLNNDRLTATGFLVLGPKVLAEPDKEKMVMDIVDEQIDVTTKAFLGLTVSCARCHDHKFDPIPTKDYYGLAGIFKSTRTMETLRTVARAYERPLADAETVARQKEHQQKLAAKQDELKQTTARVNQEVSTGFLRQFAQYLLASLDADVAPSGLAGAPDLQRPGAVLLEAEKFARGDVQVNNDTYGKEIGIIESAGRAKAFTEYEFELPADGQYELFVRYASGESRPVRLSLDGKVIQAAAARVATGGFGPDRQRWVGETAFMASAGKHVLRMDQAAGALPHLDKLAIVPASVPEAAPAGPSRRKIKPEQLASERGLNAQVLSRLAAHVAGTRQDRIFDAWHQFAALPADRFADEAARLVVEWKAKDAMKGWRPQVAALFSAEAPKSLEEVAQRYQKLFTEVDQAWHALARRNGNAKALGNADQEALRQVLYGNNSPFDLGKPEQYYPMEARGAVDGLKKEVEALEKSMPRFPMALAVAEAEEISNVQVHIRGNHLTLGEDAPRLFLRIIAGEQQTPVGPDRSGRLELAEWLTQPEHPLTARVMVNRIWLHHFGEGLVNTPDNFGLLGDRPSHPELLDWLARQFIAKGWSVKAMHKLILTSNAYQMSTAYNAKAALADPENRLLWRMNRRRVEVEAMRDGMLFVAGNLDRTMGGSLLTTGNFAYVTNDQSGNAAQYDTNRRSIYLPVIRNAVFDVFQIFDFVEPSFLNGKRASTTVAPQALFLLNGKFVLEQSQAFANRLLQLGVADDAERVRAAYRSVFGREATGEEVQEALAFIQGFAQRLEAKEPDAERRRQKSWQGFCQLLFASSEFIYLN